MSTNACIISKHDAKVLQAATNILSRLQHESYLRLDLLQKSAKSQIRQDYWNAKRRDEYFVNACNKCNVNITCSGRILLGAQ